MVSSRALQAMSDSIVRLVKESLTPMDAKERESVHKDSWFSTMKRDRAAFKSAISFELVLQKLQALYDEQGLLTEMEIAVLECIHYLMNVEGPLQTISAQLCLYAVKAGSSFEVRRGTQIDRILTSEAILDTSMDEKLRFLASCHVRIPPGIWNRKLRNSVAHMDFSIKADGTVGYDNEEISYAKLQRLVWNTRDVFVAMQRAVAGVVGAFLKKDGWTGPLPLPLSK